ncbi:TrkA C-terminal domain-containing protein [Streptomyces sp. SPB162]|uniref:CASTOR/POLLUX-related putative ion channel n=1 Tax=Streptomyces sp. SPB162 TaxID=2940560 RepID=UPI002406CABD|nr:TrkA C-terminal domain-containing protein [Streptomyces sp. SPB162]MDF9810907.1 K+/H+ antiporter YhaU regulatory subunit KhtT [Streptomyces sp. SPB162]
MVQHVGTLWRRLQYRFDNLVSRSTAALIGWLTLACLGAVVPVSVVLVWTDRRTPATFSGRLAAVWVSVGQTLKIGGAVGSPLYVMASILLALVALLFVSALVSLITTGINQRILELRMGHSAVLEARHTVVLGWSDSIFSVLAELVTANTNQRRSIVTVLASKDKVEMEEEIGARLGDTGSTSIVCRTGSTTDPAALARVSPQTAKAILVLPPDGDDGDAHVVKTLLALNAPTPESGDAIVIAAVQDAQNHLTATLAAGPRGRVLAIDDIVARLVVQTARQPGLSLVYEELLDFAGDEFYTVAASGLVGRTFGDALLAFSDASVVGLLRAGDIALNPDPRTAITENDRIIVIAPDDDTVVLVDASCDVDPGAIVTATSRPPTAQRLLMLGWNRRGPLILDQLALRQTAPTTLDVVARGDGPAPTGTCDTADGARHLDVTFHGADTTDPRVLNGLDVLAYDSVIVVGDTGHHASAAAHLATRATETDDRTLVTLLHLRAIEEATRREIPLTTEMADDRNRLLAPVRAGVDFIVSGRLISLLMTQLSESPYLAGLFDELFTPEGSELYLKPAADYVRAGEKVTFATVVAAARQRHECALGYRLRAQAATGPAYGVRINPDKRHPVRFTAEDWVIVLAGS